MAKRKLLGIKFAVLIIIALISMVPLFLIFSNNQVTNKATTGIIFGFYANPDYGMRVNSFSMEITTQKEYPISFRGIN